MSSTLISAPPATVDLMSSAGLRVELEILPWAHSLAAVLVVGCGSAEDQPGREGTVHLAEHLMVLSDPAGGTSGEPIFAVTEIDRTVFRATGDPADAGPLLRRLLDVAAGRHGSWGPETFEGERHAVVVETRRMDHQPMLRLGPMLAAAAATETSLDAIGRTTVASVGQVSEADVAAVVRHGYTPSRARLFLAGPASVLPTLQALLRRHEVDSATSPSSGTEPRRHDPGRPLRLPSLDNLVAVTSLRPRAENDTELDTILDPYGPIVGLTTGSPLRPAGRVTIQGQREQVDIVVWRGTDVIALIDERLRITVGGGLPEEMHAAERRLRVRRAAEREWQLVTPAGRADHAAAQFTFPGSPSGVRELALWTIAGGRPERLNCHSLDSPYPWRRRGLS